MALTWRWILITRAGRKSLRVLRVARRGSGRPGPVRGLRGTLDWRIHLQERMAKFPHPPEPRLGNGHGVNVISPTQPHIPETPHPLRILSRPQKSPRRFLNFRVSNRYPRCFGSGEGFASGQSSVPLGTFFFFVTGSITPMTSTTTPISSR